MWSCGLSMALIDDIPTCKELIENIVRQAEDVLGKQVMPMLSAGGKMQAKL